MSITLLIVALGAFLAGGISAVAGFGIGSILTPLLGLFIGVRLAVPAASIPHFVGNALRLWTLRGRVDRRVFIRFAVTSAAGALTGALLHAVVATGALKVAFAFFLIVFGVLGVFRRTASLRLPKSGAWAAGYGSGMLGGLIGNQGGLRAAAMLALEVPKEAFVATAVAVALVVDGVRMPIYAFSSGTALLSVWPLVATATAAVVAGTYAGKALFSRIDEELFQRLVSGLLIALGIAIILAR